MKLDAATIPIEPRALGPCLDLAAAFYRVHLKPILVLVAAFAVPATALAAWLARSTGSGLELGLVLFFLASPVLGALLVAGAGPCVFGDAFTARRAASFFRRRAGRVIRALGWPRLLLLLGGLVFASGGPPAVLLFLPVPIFVLGRAFMVAEVGLLEQLAGARARARLRSLRQGVTLDLVGRWMGAALFFGLVVAILFVLADRAAEILFGVKILLGRVESIADELLFVLAGTPRAAALLQALLWLVYPLVRLALFFCYLDVRIQREGWDLELDGKIEARRLEGGRA